MIAASVHQTSRKPVKFLFKLVLDPKKIGGHEFFLLDHVNTLKLIISGDLYELSRKHKLNLRVSPI